MPAHSSLPRILCVGVDVTWWGGGREAASRWETIVSATLDASTLSIDRVDLAGHPNPNRRLPTEPNFDADGKAICAAILDTIGRHPGVEHVVLALDAPLSCRERPGQPARCKAVARGDPMGTLQRDSERALREYMSGLHRDVRAEWNQDLRIQPGSPVPCRIARAVERLRASAAAAMSPYRAGDAVSPRGIVEVFPSEAIWALGLLGAYGELGSSAVRAYKAKTPRMLPVAEAHTVARRPLEGFLLPLRDGGLPAGTARAWIDQIVGEAIDLATNSGGAIRKSKRFDDPIDSGIAFLTAAACALGQFHEWGDGPDGTIVGPGRL
jgi:hypothetical protein